MIYFDNAATSYPKPPSVAREVSRCIDEYCGNPGRGAHPLALAAVEKIYACRCALADLFKAEAPEGFVFTQNATHALNLAIKSRAQKSGRILISDVEHNAVRRPVHRLLCDGICTYELFNTSGNDDDILLDIEKKCLIKPDILVCTHVSNVTGRVLPINKIGKFCKSHGIYFVIDASQSAGHRTIDFSSLDFDVFCAPGHKGLFGIQGSGFAYFRTSEKLQTLIEGGSGYDSSNLYMPDLLPEKFEAGTLSTPAIVSLYEGVRFISDIGIDEISSREAFLTKRCRDMLASFESIQLYPNAIDADRESPAGPISFTCEKHAPEKLAALLSEGGVCVRAGMHCAPLAHMKIGTAPTGTVRISLGYFNDMSEIDRLYDILKSIIR